MRQLIDSGESARQRVRVNGEVQLIVGIPLATGASYYQSLPFRRVDNALRTLTLAMLAAGAAGLVLNALWARAATRRALRPVDELTAAARAVARGELGTRMPEHDRDLAQVARVFNTTTADWSAGCGRMRASPATSATNCGHR
jgi:HAMP domain-containing protein